MRISPDVKGLIRDACEIDDKLPYDIVAQLLDEYWRGLGNVDQTYVKEEYFKKIDPYIPDHLRDNFCTINVSDIFCNPEKAIDTICKITNRSSTPSLEYLFKLYKDENIKLFERYNIPFIV